MVASEFLSGSKKHKRSLLFDSDQKPNSKSGKKSAASSSKKSRGGDVLSSDGALTQDHLSQNDTIEANSHLLNPNIIDDVPKTTNLDDDSDKNLDGSIKAALKGTRCLSKDGENALIKNCVRCGAIIFDVSSCFSPKYDVKFFAIIL